MQPALHNGIYRDSLLLLLILPGLCKVGRTLFGRANLKARPAFRKAGRAFLWMASSSDDLAGI